MSPGVPRIPDLPAELRNLLHQVPAGRVTTYGRLAAALGDKAAARWTGEWMLDHPHDAGCPCHRVVRQNGELGLFIEGDIAEKALRLRSDGVPIDHGRVDLEAYGWTDFTTGRPLAKLVEFQRRLPELVQMRPLDEMPALAAGVDVSYSAGGRGVAAYALIDVPTKGLVWSCVVERPISFPYISGMLAFRELSLHLDLLQEVREAGRMAPLLLVDGHGRLHPRRAGIATHLGVIAGVPTIGVGKRLLCGRVDLDRVEPGRPQPVIDAGEPIGMAIRAGPTSRPIFVSPGQLIDVASAAEFTERLFAGHRLPEPIYHADRLSRSVAKAR